MIKKITTITLTLFVGVDFALSQNLSVSSVKMIQTDSTCFTSPRYDLNGNACAVVKVFANNLIGLLDFKGDIIGEVKGDAAKYTIYVPERTKRLKIYHPDYIPETIDFTQHEDSKKGLEGNHVYYVSISGNESVKSGSISNVSGSRILSFSSDVPLRQLFVNGVEWKITDNTSKRLMPYGEYEYEAVTDENIRKKGNIKLIPSIGSMIVKIIFDNR
jgi:hypothetical protein